MTETAPPALAAELQEHAAVDLSAADQPLLFERYLKQDQWPARSVGLPLLLGIDPADWAAVSAGGDAREQALWSALAAELESDRTGDPEVAVGQLVNAAQALGLTLPPAFKRIFDFVRLAVAVGVPATAAEPAQGISPGERERVLGAALQLVTKIPQHCRDANGFFDGARIAAEIAGKSPRWFPDGPPRMTEADMARLIEEWLE